MIDITWKLFSQTGNIGAYLLLKELENDPSKNGYNKTEDSTVNRFNTKM